MSQDGNTNSAPPTVSTANAPDDLPPIDRWVGATLGKYRIVRQIGRGGMGVVYEAQDPVLQRSVAVKVLREGVAAQPESLRKFLREARTAARLNHPHIVAVYEADQEKGMCYLVMEMMQGGSAHDRLRKWGPFGWVEATQVLADACRGLSAVHAAGLIHRDVKPSNIMRAEDGTVKLTDFGLALTATGSSPAANSTSLGQIVGTPLYMSPEQCRGERIDPRSDLYSLGATYYSLLTGKPPFDGPNPADIMSGHCYQSVPDPRETDPQIPSACVELLRRTMAKDVVQRPPNAEALLAELDSVLLLATSSDAPPLDWASDDENALAPTTVVAPLTVPFQKTRTWFVVFGLILIGLAYGAGRYWSHPAPVADPPSGGNSTVAPPAAGVPAVDAGKKPAEFEAGSRVNSLAFDPHEPGSLGWGTQLGSAKVVRLLFHKDRHSETAAKGQIPEPVRQVAFLPLGNRWMSLYNGSLHFYETPEFQKTGTSANAAIDSLPQGPILAVAFHPREKLLALSFREEASSKGGIVFRELSPKPRDHEQFMEDQRPPECLAFSTDGSLLVCGKPNGNLHVWRFAFQKKRFVDEMEWVIERRGAFPVGKQEIVAVAAIDRDHFAVASGLTVVKCDGRLGKRVETLHQGNREVRCLAVAPGVHRLACAAGNQVMLYDLSTGDRLGEPFEHPQEVTALAFDGEGKQLASGDAGGKVIVWPVK